MGLFKMSLLNKYNPVTKLLFPIQKFHLEKFIVRGVKNTHSIKKSPCSKTHKMNSIPSFEIQNFTPIFYWQKFASNLLPFANIDLVQSTKFVPDRRGKNS